MVIAFFKYSSQQTMDEILLNPRPVNDDMMSPYIVIIYLGMHATSTVDMTRMIIQR